MKIAIYSRKSKFTGKGESIENQIEMCQSYIISHFADKENNISIFEDEGFSGKNLDRPQFKEMMNEEYRSPFNLIIVYRLDRISRNVGDFSNLIDKLNSYNTSVDLSIQLVRTWFKNKKRCPSYQLWQTTFNVQRIYINLD